MISPYFCSTCECECVVVGRTAGSENEWVSAGKGKGNASQNKVCSSNRFLQGFSQNGSIDEDHCIRPKCCLAQGEKSWHYSSKERQLKGTDVCVSHGRGGVPTVMQLVSKYRSPRATCVPLLNMKEESFPDGLEGELCGALRDAYRHTSPV